MPSKTTFRVSSDLLLEIKELCAEHGYTQRYFVQSAVVCLTKLWDPLPQDVVTQSLAPTPRRVVNYALDDEIKAELEARVNRETLTRDQLIESALRHLLATSISPPSADKKVGESDGNQGPLEAALIDDRSEVG